MKVVDRTMKSFFGLLKEHKKGNYNKSIKLPHYLKKDGRFVMIFTPAHFKLLENNKIRLTVNKMLLEKHNIKSLIIDLPKHITNKTIKEIRINPHTLFFKVEFVYLEDEENYTKVDKNNNFLSMDLGVDNLCTIIDNMNNQPILICGREIKSYNRLFNKKLAKNKSIAMKVNGRYSTKRIESIYNKRNNYLKDKFHKISNYIISYCLDNNISKIIVGYNQEWKQNIDLGNINQSFVQIPYSRLINYLQYKGQLHNIEVVLQEESYTSKCDSLAFESIEKHTNYKGKRVKRGLFQSSVNELVNSDVNGAINIARKCIGDTLNPWIKELASSGIVNMPIRVRLSTL